ncbi:MAG: PEP-CTERM sorting domain-containing protein [Candidatus Thiodiazotropha sp. (ex Epidulcina cf. delphinae)]|nr:PEP-CTERM sorting domain-containing protein [Candidatus Thiodiazotropha sp. (ex Epidulcina cf. delphinae)]
MREIGTDFLDANWRYVNSLGDGGVIGEIGGNSWDIVIDPVLYTGFNTSLAAYGATGTSLALDINTSEAIVFRVSSVPEPGTLALLAISLVVLSRRYKRTV